MKILHAAGTVRGSILDLGSLNLEDPKYLVSFSFVTKGNYFNDILSK